MQPTDDVLRSMAAAATGRATMWHLCGEVASRPTEDFVRRLRDGNVAITIQQSTAWLGESSPFDELVAALGAYRARSARYTLEQDVGELEEEWGRLALGRDVARVCAQCEARATAESEAWAAGDHEAAKVQRKEQFESASGWLEALSRWCARADAETQVLVMRVLIRVVAAHVSTESGRDLLGTLEDTGRTAFFRF